MDFVEKRKGNTYKSKKSRKGKDLASLKYTCRQCRGICIFSRTFFENYPKSASLRAKLDERFYSAEFEYLRSLENKPQHEKKAETEPNLNAEDEAENATIFDLLKKFQALDRSAKWRVQNCHSSAVCFEKRTNKLDRYDLWNICRCCLRSNIPKRESRQKRQSKLIFNSLGDIKIQY